MHQAQDVLKLADCITLILFNPEEESACPRHLMSLSVIRIQKKPEAAYMSYYIRVKYTSYNTGICLRYISFIKNNKIYRNLFIRASHVRQKKTAMENNLNNAIAIFYYSGWR